MSFFVYILQCADGSYYTGHTDNLEQRLAQHQFRYFSECYTANRLPVELKYQQAFPTREEALAAERKIKGWSRKKKESMMRGGTGHCYPILHALTQRQPNHKTPFILRLKTPFILSLSKDVNSEPTIKTVPNTLRLRSG